MFSWLTGRRKEAPVSKAEQRRAQRLACGRRVQEHLTASVGAAAWPALVCDISTAGVGLVIGQRHEPGTVLPLLLANTQRQVARPLQVQVVHAGRRPDGYWQTGCVFAGALRKDEIEALV